MFLFYAFSDAVSIDAKPKSTCKTFGLVEGYALFLRWKKDWISDGVHWPEASVFMR